MQKSEGREERWETGMEMGWGWLSWPPTTLVWPADTLFLWRPSQNPACSKDIKWRYARKKENTHLLSSSQILQSLVSVITLDLFCWLVVFLFVFFSYFWGWDSRRKNLSPQGFTIIMCADPNCLSADQDVDCMLVREWIRWGEQPSTLLPSNPICGFAAAAEAAENGGRRRSANGVVLWDSLPASKTDKADVVNICQRLLIQSAPKHTCMIFPTWPDASQQAQAMQAGLGLCRDSQQTAPASGTLCRCQIKPGSLQLNSRAEE